MTPSVWSARPAELAAKEIRKGSFVADLQKRKDKGVQSWLIGLSGKPIF